MVALAGLWMAGGSGARASSEPSGTIREAAHGGHLCKCGMRCGEVCCCASDEPTALVPAAPEVPGTEYRPGPCMSSVPCGGALPPTTGLLTLVGESADRTAAPGAEPAPSRMLLDPPASDRGRACDGSGVDEPPEHRDAA